MSSPPARRPPKKVGKSKLKIRLTGKGKKLLKKAKSIKLTAKASFTPKGGKKRTARHTFKLRR